MSKKGEYTDPLPVKVGVNYGGPVMVPAPSCLAGSYLLAATCV